MKLVVFIEDPLRFVPNNHQLHGERNTTSINITGDYRLLYEQYNEDTVRIVDIDTHSNLNFSS